MNLFQFVNNCKYNLVEEEHKLGRTCHYLTNFKPKICGNFLIISCESFNANDNVVCLASVCFAWKAMFEQFWSMVDLKVRAHSRCPAYPSKWKKIEMADFHQLLKIGGHRLTSITLEIHHIETYFLRGCINEEEYIITGEFHFYDFLEVIANVSSNLQILSCYIKKSIGLKLVDVSSFSAAISKLIGRNRKLRSYKMHIFRPHAKFFQLKDLPESVEDVAIHFFVEDYPVICDVSEIII